MYLSDKILCSQNIRTSSSLAKLQHNHVFHNRNTPNSEGDPEPCSTGKINRKNIQYKFIYIKNIFFKSQKWQRKSVIFSFAFCSLDPDLIMTSHSPLPQLTKAGSSCLYRVTAGTAGRPSHGPGVSVMLSHLVAAYQRENDFLLDYQKTPNPAPSSIQKNCEKPSGSKWY